MSARKASNGHRLTVYVPKPLYRRLKTEAVNRKASIGELVRKRLEQDQRQVTPLDILGDLVGSVKGGPSDLSGNDKYLEGLGNDIAR
jgi:hypothetical protein